MTTDPLLQSDRADRLHYATGELLGADDFRAEQTYHRRQFARALTFLHGRGTVAGLEVQAVQQTGAGGAPDEVEVTVAAGLAIDGAGRLVEVPIPASIRLQRWFTYIAGRPDDNVEYDAADLRSAWRPDANFAVGGSVVADVFLAFQACDRGYTPAFASGPFDALDASQPSRVRDAYELSLVLRSEADADLPAAFDPYSGVTNQDQIHARILQAWSALMLPEAPDLVNPFHENPAGFDPTAVLLARLRIPATQAPALPAGSNPNRAPIPDMSAAAWADPVLNLDNNVRRWVVPPAALARLAGV